jgi:hypothetical protein
MGGLCAAQPGKVIVMSKRKAEQEEQKVKQATILGYEEDQAGLYAKVLSSTGRTTYQVRICAKFWCSTGCQCPNGYNDCRHRQGVDAELREIRPTLSEQIAGFLASKQAIVERLTPVPPRYCDSCQVAAKLQTMPDGRRLCAVCAEHAASQPQKRAA